MAIQYAPKEIKDIYEICLEAVKSNPNALYLLSSTIQSDPDFILECIT